MATTEQKRASKSAGYRKRKKSIWSAVNIGNITVGYVKRNRKYSIGNQWEIQVIGREVPDRNYRSEEAAVNAIAEIINK